MTNTGGAPGLHLSDAAASNAGRPETERVGVKYAPLNCSVPPRWCRKRLHSRADRFLEDVVGSWIIQKLRARKAERRYRAGCP